MDLRRWIAAAALGAAALSAHAVGQRADVNVYDRSTGQQLPVFWHEGRAYVVGRPGNEFEVRVRNAYGQDLLAVVSVDGVNVVSGQTANPRQSGYVLSPWQRVDIRGWRKSLDEIAAFYFTTLGDSYAGRTGRPDNVGVIGVALFERRAFVPPKVLSDNRAWGSGAAEAQPAERADLAKRESRAAPAAPAASAPLGTGHGRREESQTREVPFERASDEPVETIAIHYDSYRNLVARGIFPSPYARRDPEPFPGRFVPDPPR